MRALLLLAVACTTADKPDDPDLPAEPQPARVEVQTTSGTIQGDRSAASVSFMGIPYAAPPTGALRFAAPAPHPGWGDTLVLPDQPPQRCPQEVPFLGLSTEEDCLFLNVHVPDPVPPNPSVLFWIHGGGFTLGEGVQSDFGTHGARLAEAEGIVVVSVNYRLGQLGFLSHPALAAEDPRAVGNYGFLDQVAALQWVNDNLEAFVDDPGPVTIAGQSAGGISVCGHLISPDSAGLFDQAIVMSSPCQVGMPAEMAAAQCTRFAAELPTPCDDAACLRATPVADLLGTLASSDDLITPGEDDGLWSPVIDGTVLPDNYLAALQRGDFHQVPILTGFTANEGRVFAALGGEDVTEEGYEDALRGLVDQFGGDVDAVLAAYALGPGDDPTLGFYDAIGDILLACGTRDTAEAIAQHVPTQAYLFAYPDPPFQVPQSFDMGAYHAGEIQYVFGHPAALTATEHEGDDLDVYDAMRAAFGAFVRTGTATIPGGPHWPAYSAGGDSLVFDRTLSTVTDAWSDRCAVWGPNGS
jgi:para-nitrobenzyl esterase